MPKVLRILNRLIIGGPVLNATYLTKYLSPDFETLLVVGEKEGHEQGAQHLTQHLDIKYLSVPEMGRSINPLTDYQSYQKLKKIIKDFKPDIVHTHAAKPGALGRLAASALNVPAIVHTYHGHVFHSYFNSVATNFFIKTERFLAKRSHAIVAISEAQKKELVDEFKIAPKEKFCVIPLGLDLDKFTIDQDEKRKVFRKEFNLKDNEIAIGIIGRLVPVKNHQLFIKSISFVLKNSPKKIKAFIIGDGETRAALEKTATEEGIKFTTHKDSVHPHPLIFTSWRTDVDVINAGLDIITLTSFNEGTPVSLIEAQAANKPIVSTRVGGIADVVIEGETALLADINNTSVFCEHLLHLVQNDELRMSLGKKASEHVIKKYSYHRLMTDMSALYYDLLRPKVPANAILR